MDYMKLKLAIYESYGNGEMTSEACSHLIDHLDEKYGESIVEEAANAENEFINASLNVFTESACEEALTEAAKNFGAKVKAAWEKFKTWIKNIIAKILGLGKKPEQQKAKIQVPKALDKALSDAKKWIAKLGGAKTAGAMAAAVAGIVTSTAAIVKNRKLKETMGAKVYEYEKFKKEQADLVKEMQDAALKAQNEIADLKQDLSNEKGSSANAMDMAEKHFNELNGKLSQAKSDLAAAQSSSGEKDNKIKELQTKITDLEKQLSEAKAKKAEAPKQTKSDNTPGENVTDSKILSVSTGLVNAVTQTVVALLPAASQTTITSDEIRNSADKNPGKLKNAIRGTGAKVDGGRNRYTIAFRNNRDIELLRDTGTEAKSGFYFIQNELMLAISRDPENKNSSVIYKNELTNADFKSRFSNFVGSLDKNGDLYLDDIYYSDITKAYNLNTEDGCVSYVQDVNSCSGRIHSMTNDVLNYAKKPMAEYPKYREYEVDQFSKKDIGPLVKLYNDLYVAWKKCDGLYDAIRDASSDVRDFMKDQKKDN